MDCPPVSPGGGSEVPEALLEPGAGAGLTGSPWGRWAAHRERARGGAKPGGAGRGGDGGRSQLCSRGWPLLLGRHRERGSGGAAGGVPRGPLGGRRGGWERPLRALLGPQGSASSGRGGGVRTTGQGTGTAWSREPRSPPSVGTTWRSQKGLAFGLKALTAPP